MQRAARIGGLAALGVAVALAGCSSTTYGTGTSPGMQTLKDITGIADITGSKTPVIDYEARPKVVMPPAVAQLPPPALADVATAAVPDWPNDPDTQRAKLKAEVAAREAAGQPMIMPNLTPEQLKAMDALGIGGDRKLTPEETAKLKKLFADAKGGVGFDANGNPIRQYLTDPPPEYRVPDPTAPVEVAAKKKKFHWFWQKDDDTADDGPAPSTSTDAPAVTN